MPDHIWKHVANIQMMGIDYLVLCPQEFRHLALERAFIELWIAEGNRESI